MDDVDIIINEEGKLRDMKTNVYVPEYGDVLVGPVIVVGVDEKNCVWTSVPEDKIKEIENYIESNQIILSQREKDTPKREKQSVMEEM